MINSFISLWIKNKLSKASNIMCQRVRPTQNKVNQHPKAENRLSPYRSPKSSQPAYIARETVSLSARPTVCLSVENSIQRIFVTKTRCFLICNERQCQKQWMLHTKFSIVCSDDFVRSLTLVWTICIRWRPFMHLFVCKCQQSYVLIQ